MQQSSTYVLTHAGVSEFAAHAARSRESSRTEQAEAAETDPRLHQQQQQPHSQMSKNVIHSPTRLPTASTIPRSPQLAHAIHDSPNNTKRPPNSPADHHQKPSAIPQSAANQPSRPAQPKMYRNEEVLLFRVPGDESFVVLFNLPSKPFIHAFYDLKTVAEARKLAQEAMLREQNEKDARMIEANTTPSIATAGSSSTNVSAATLSVSSNAAATGSITTAAAVNNSSAMLIEKYLALHLLNVERVLHSIAPKFGLVYDLSVHSKRRDASHVGSGKKKRRAPNIFDDGNIEEESPLEQIEQNYLRWAYVKYYSTLHAAVAIKGFNKIALGKGRKLKANLYEKPWTPPAITAPAAATAAASSNVSGPLPSILLDASTPSSTGESNASSNSDHDNENTLRPYFPLSYHRCLDMCNYFLGFNNWNCEIKELRRYQHSRDQDLMDDAQKVDASFRQSFIANFRHSWTATVVVTMAGQQFSCSGVGHTERADESIRAKKKAVTNAYRQLFASLALVILHNGKVAVQVLP